MHMSLCCYDKLWISGTDFASFSIVSGTGVLTTGAAVSAATKASYSVNVESTGTVTGTGKVALTVEVKAACSAASQMAAAIGIILLSLMTALHM